MVFGTEAKKEKDQWEENGNLVSCQIGVTLNRAFITRDGHSSHVSRSVFRTTRKMDTATSSYNERTGQYLNQIEVDIGCFL